GRIVPGPAADTVERRVAADTCTNARGAALVIRGNVDRRQGEAGVRRHGVYVVVDQREVVLGDRLCQGGRPDELQVDAAGAVDRIGDLTQGVVCDLEHRRGASLDEGTDTVASGARQRLCSVADHVPADGAGDAAGRRVGRREHVDRVQRIGEGHRVVGEHELQVAGGVLGEAGVDSILGECRRVDQEVGDDAVIVDLDLERTL